MAFELVITGNQLEIYNLQIEIYITLEMIYKLTDLRAAKFNSNTDYFLSSHFYCTLVYNKITKTLEIKWKTRSFYVN